MVIETGDGHKSKYIGPSPRAAFSMAYDLNAKKVVLFGGVTVWTAGMNDTWEWDGTEWSGSRYGIIG